MNIQTYITLRDIAVLIANLMLLKYFIFLIAASLYPIQETLRQIKIIKKNKSNYHPKVSVIIPAWNEEVGVLKTVKTAIDNTYDNVEILIINDGSTDKTSSIVNDFIKKNCRKDLRVRRLRKNDIKYIKFIDNKINGGKGKALNDGILNSTGEIILTVDADSILDRDAIKNLVKYFADDTIDGVVGNVKVGNDKTIIGLMQKLEYRFGFYFKRAHSVLGAEYIFGGACASFRRNVFDDIGLYDTENKTEDIEMTMRFRYAGYICTYAEDVICFTEGASSIKGLSSQRLRWKKGRMDTFIKYRNLFFSLKKNHNKPLSFFILPLAVISEIQLFFEPIFLSLLIGYSFISLDFISLAFGILFLFVVYLVNAIFNNKRIDFKLILMFPSTWLLFYFLVWIEFLSLLRSVILLVRGQNISWQKWERTGI